MRKTILILIGLLIAPAILGAQATVAPSPEAAGNPRGENHQGYNILNSFELGYRWRTVDGNYGKYRSDVNFGNGIRLLGSQLRVNSREGHGGLFDEISLTTQGLGNDPYQSANLRVEKNRFYRYDMMWRENQYFNPALTIANGLHRMDTQRRLQDHDVTLFPQSSFKLFFGYSRNTQTGPALTTMQVFDSRGDEFPLFADIKRNRREFRLGGEAVVAGFKLNVLHGWDSFEDDTPISLPAASAGVNPNDSTTLTRLTRTEPYQGDSPYWRLALFRNEKRYSINARYSNVSGRRNFVFDDLFAGTDRLGNARTRQTMVTGAGSRPVNNGSLNVAFLPNSRLTLTNYAGFSNTRMDGSALYRQIDNDFASDVTRDFQFLGIRTIENQTDAVYSATGIISLRGGYHFSDRKIVSREGSTFGDFTDVVSYEQSNRVHSGLAGVRLRPLKPLTIHFDLELGRADRPFFTISEKNYHALSGRVQYKMKSLTLAAWTRTFYNTNSTNLFAHSSRSRQYAYDISWSAVSWLSFDAGYSKLHLDTLTGLAYFAGGSLVESNRSLYVSNLHSGNFGLRLAMRNRADIYLGYSIVKDTGDGRSESRVFPTPASGSDPNALLPFFVAQTFPLSYQSPQARLSVRLKNRLRWNLGYQHYAYREDFYPLTYQNYRAHTGYSSLVWSF